MKWIRWTYYVVMGISLVMGMYTGLRLYYIVLFTLLFTMLASLGLSQWTVRSFKFSQTLSTSVCEKGAETQLHLEIINECPIPLSLIEVHINVVSVRKDVNLVFNLAPYSGQTFDILVSAPYRGRYPIGMTKLRISDIFGLTVLPFDMRRLSYYRMPELIVLPRAQTPGTVSSDIVDTKLFGDPLLKPAEQGDSVSGARLFHDGDRLKHIHWKKSAQQGVLFVKQYEYPEREHITILIDTSLYGLAGEAALIYSDTVCECAASIALNSLSHGRTVHIQSTGTPAAQLVIRSLSQYGILRRHLAMLSFERQPDSTLARTVSRFGAQQMRSLFVITRSHAPSTIPTIQTILKNVEITFVLVGEKILGTFPQAIFVAEGSVAAEHLSGIH